MIVEVCEDAAALPSKLAQLQGLAAIGLQQIGLYLTPAYLASYVETFPEKNYLLVSLSAAGDVHAAALFVKVRGPDGDILRFAGEGLWGYSGFMAKGEQPAEIGAQLLRAAVEHGQPRWVEIGPVHESALESHAEIARAAGLPGQVMKYAGGAPFIDTSVHQPSYIEGLKKAAYRDSLRCEKRLNELGSLGIFKLDNASLTEAAMHTAMHAFLGMYERQWPDNRFKREPRWKQFYQTFGLAAARAGMLEFSFLTIDGKPLAAHFGCLHAGRRYYFTPTYDVDYAKYSPGKVLLRKLIDTSFEQQVVFDFQNDLEAYKLDWSTAVAERYLIKLNAA